MAEKRARILVVEDDPLVAGDIERGLRELEYDVCGVRSTGEEAVATNEELHPDIILMDIRLRGQLTGIEAAKLIRHESGIPVIFLTALSDDGTLKKAKEAQPVGYLLKPFGL